MITFLDERYYKGIRPCLIISHITPLKSVKVRWMDTGTYDIVLVRMCWRKRKEKK